VTTSAPETTFIAEPGSLEGSTIAVIDAPREAVYRAHVEQELLTRWWAPPELEVKVDEFDPTPGGRWRILNYDADGTEYAFKGVFHDLVPNERIVQTFEWEGMPRHVCLQTATFEDVDGGTKVTAQAVFQSVEDRDGMAESGWREQAPVGMANLSEVARSL
jgi:uncharacterized protein YndB with AHSA1/START domain